MPCSTYAEDPATKPAKTATPATSPQPKLVASPEIVVDLSGARQELLTLRNDTDKEMRVSLRAIVTSTTNARTRIRFKGEQDQGEAEAAYSFLIPANGMTRVWAMITEVTSEGAFEADLKNKDESIGTIKGTRLPFAVKLDETNPEKLSMVDGLTTSIVLKNEDPAPYPLIWRLSINGQEVCGDKITLAASGLGVLECKPSVPFRLSRVQDLFKPEDGSKGGRLLIYPQTPGEDLKQASPWKIIPVDANLSSFGPFTQQFWGYLTIVGVLLLGGATSLVLSQALPNRLKRLNIKDRLNGSAVATANLSSNVDSRLQVTLRVECSRLLELLNSRKTFSPEFATVVARCTNAATKLESRVSLVQQIDDILGQLDQTLSTSPPPSQIVEIERLINDAKVHLVKPGFSDSDSEAVKAALTEANKQVEILNETDVTFGQKLAARALKLKDDITASVSTTPVFLDLDKALPGPWRELRKVLPGTTEIAVEEYSSVDRVLEKVLLMKKYVIRREGTADQEVLDRLKLKQATLLKHLAPESWPAIRSARLLLREMEDDVYADRLGEVLVEKKAHINMDPSIAYDKAPLRFCICFNDQGVDDSAAKEEWTCEWSFGDNLTEKGWTVSHYFRLPSRRFWFLKTLPKDFPVRASFRKPDGELLMDGQSEKLVIEEMVTVKPSAQEGLGDRSRTELVKLIAALFIAVFALVAGAKEELLKLDILPGLIAVFLVGFGADTIKNLLTSKSETEP